jgi:hypothetical protein
MDAEGFLKEQLCDGPRDAKAVEAEADDLGITEGTLKRAKRRLGVVSTKAGMDGWLWSLPTGDGLRPTVGASGQGSVH